LAASDEIAVVDTKTTSVVRRLSDASPAGPSEGSTPNALLLSEDESTLFVAEADNNAIAVFDISEAASSSSKPVARIPTDWYPTAIAAGKDAMLVLCGKGHGTRANPDGPIPGERLTRRTGYDLGQLNGSLRVMSPRLDSASVADYSRRVSEANNWGEQRSAKSYPPFKHV